MRLASDTLRLRASALADSPSRPIAARHSQQSAAPPARVLDRWQLLRQQFASDHAALYEARPMTQPSDAPTDYLVKVARQADSAGIAVALLRRERAVADSVFHPHLVAILDGSLQAATPYLVLANVGVPLSRCAGAPYSLRLALWRTRQAAAALAALHAAGWIHARLTPSALLVSARGHVTVHELGWSRRIGSEECRGEHLLAADLQYIAPEMLCDATALTAECDVYCLGLLLIELLIGRPAVDRDFGWQAALAHLRGEMADVRELRPEVPASLAGLIYRMTSREPLRRPSMELVHLQLLRLEISQLARGQASVGVGGGKPIRSPS